MFDIYEKAIHSHFAGTGTEWLIAQDDMILAHGRGWGNPTVIDDVFVPTLQGKPVDTRGHGWRKLRGFALENSQGWAADMIEVAHTQGR